VAQCERLADPRPQHAQSAPFASESGLQRFIEEHAEALLGIRVIASARPDGRGMFKIDILAADQDGQPWIIECKHDLVDARALKQLQGYRAALMTNWVSVRERLEGRLAVTLSSDPQPILVLVGYRYDDTFADDRTVCLAYRYHDIEFTDDKLQQQKPGCVSLHSASHIGAPERGHPKVSKKLATSERLERLAPTLAKSFWDIDAELRNFRGVKVAYGGKNFVRYRTRAGTFAEAVICPGAIQWRITLKRTLQRDSDKSSLLTMLRDAHGKAG
jgi:hypothetical protein